MEKQNRNDATVTDFINVVTIGNVLIGFAAIFAGFIMALESGWVYFLGGAGAGFVWFSLAVVTNVCKNYLRNRR